MKTILVIDDDRPIATMVADLLEGEGYGVLVAYDGQEGYEQLATHHVDLIVSDVMMPRLNGPMLAQLLRQNPAYRHIPLIMMSAVPQAYTLPAHLSDGFLSKPFALHTLLTLIQARLHNGQHE